MKSKFISLILSMAVILGLILVPAVTSPVLAAGEDWGFEIDPAMTKKGFSESLSVNAEVVRYGGDSASYVMYVVFNATLLNVTGVTFPALLPNGAAPFMTSSSWDNNAGWVKAEYAKTPATPDINVSFTFCTIDFDTLSVEGVSGLNFIWIDAIKATEVQLGGVDYLNWTTVVNGTVMIGAPELVLDVTPGSPPYPMATGGMAIGYNVPPDPADLPAWLADPDFVMIYPNATWPNTTTWAWDEVLMVGAVEFVPGWEFSHFTGHPGYGDLGPLWIEGYKVWGRVLILGVPSTNLTAHMTQKAPEVNVTPASLAFSPFEGIDPASQNLTIRNTGGGLLSWTLTDDADYLGHDWLSAAPASGNLYTSFLMPENVTAVSVNVSGMPQGDYSCVINVTGSTTQLIPVNLTIRPATAIDVCRNIMPNTTYSGHPGETDEVYPGEVIDVYVNFTAPPTSPNHGFNAIGVTDLAPDGWTVEVNKNWSWINGSQEAAYAVDDSTDNVAQIMWTGPFDQNTNISGMYKVTVPTTADPGLNTWPTCDDDGMADAWVEYYFNDEGPHSSPICCDREVVVTQPGNLVGETRDVNADELADVDVQLHLLGASYLWSDISTPDYTLTAWVTGDYWLVVNRTRYHQINASDAVDVPGLAFTIDLSNQTLLSDGNLFDFEGNFGLVPRACALSYVLRTVNLWTIGYPGHSEWTITEEWKVGDVINSWLYPS